MVIRTEKDVRIKRDKLVLQEGGHFSWGVKVLDWVLKEDPRSLEEKNGLNPGTITNTVTQQQHIDKYAGKSWKELTKELGIKEAKKVWEKLKNEKTGNDSEERENTGKEESK